MCERRTRVSSRFPYHPPDETILYRCRLSAVYGICVWGWEPPARLIESSISMRVAGGGAPLLSANCRRLFASKSTAAGDRRHEGAGGTATPPRPHRRLIPAAGYIDSITKMEIIRITCFLITKHEVSKVRSGRASRPDPPGSALVESQTRRPLLFADAEPTAQTRGDHAGTGEVLLGECKCPPFLSANEIQAVGASARESVSQGWLQGPYRDQGEPLLPRA